jgi:hypothetical protein
MFLLRIYQARPDDYDGCWNLSTKEGTLDMHAQTLTIRKDEVKTNYGKVM